MANSLIQRSFAAGELDPSLFSRVDQVKYATGLRTLRNAYVRKNGGLDSRMGGIYCNEGKLLGKTYRLIPFQVSVDVKYQLEVGEFYIRFLKNDSLVTDSTKNITNITQANPGVFTSASHGFSVGQELEIDGILGMDELNNRNFLVNSVPTANSYTLKYRDGTLVDTTGFSAYVSGGTASRVYEIPTTYAEAHLSRLQYSQSSDVMNLTHNSYPVFELRRTSDTSWTLLENEFRPEYNATGAVFAVTIPGAGAVVNKYMVTAISRITGEESLPIPASGGGSGGVITAITKANPAVVTTALAHGLSNDDVIRIIIDKQNGMRELNSRKFIVANVGATTFELKYENSTNYNTYVNTGTSLAIPISRKVTGSAPAPGSENVINMFPGEDVLTYNIYKELNGVYGIIGSSDTQFKDADYTPNTSITPPDALNPFPVATRYPATSAYVQQRLYFANTITDPEDVIGSAIAKYKNFTSSEPIEDSDTLRFKLSGEGVNPVRHLFNLGSMMMFTDSGEWACIGDQNGTITPSNINPKQQSYNGSSYLRPVFVDVSAVYIQEQGGVVRDLRSDFQGGDLSAFAHHLFKKNTIFDMAYQKTPNSIVWMVRDDGVLISMTYIREQQIVGFAHHDLQDGLVEAVSTYRNTDEYEVFIVVKRTIDGQVRRYTEKLVTRQIFDVIDNIFMDSALTYDGRNTGSRTMTISGGTTWSTNETLTLTASSGFFTASDVGNEIHFYNTDGQLILRFFINAFTSSTVVTGKVSSTVPVALRTIAVTNWAEAVDEISGLWHLEGESLAVLGDRNVVASPNNPSDNYDECIVVDGTVQLSQCYAVIHAGKPFIVDIETLDVDTAQGETLQNKKKLTAKVTGRFEETRGVFIGPREPSGDDLLANLYELKLREDENYDAPISLLSGIADLNIDGDWNGNGRIFIRQVDPLPLSLVSILGEGLFPFKGGA